MDDGASQSTFMSEEQQAQRRRQIREIMKDGSMSQTEKSKTIQSLMDGRRRSSSGATSLCSDDDTDKYVSNMAEAAAAAAEHYHSDEEGDEMMPVDVYGYRNPDDRSIASEITHTSYGGAPPPVPYKRYHGRSLSLQDWNDQDRAIAATNLPNVAAVSRLMEQSRPPCQHYERICSIVSPCCGLAFGCRICHDECPVLPQPLWQRPEGNSMLVPSAKPQERRRSMPVHLEQNNEENHHLIDRFAIREVICRECYTRQSSKSNNCTKCGVQFAEYHCNQCNLWMSKQEQPYHCVDCGFCRVGGRENFQHCHDCGMCIDAALFNDHNCKSGKYMSNCPICQEDLFSSRHASHEMPCGHAIHWHCFKELTSYDTRCPVCKKTADTPEQMAATWSAISMGISLQPVPPEMARMVNIYCNDCESTSVNRRWHFLGVRCNDCLSYNTNVEQIVMTGPEAAATLDRIEQHVPTNIVLGMDRDDSDNMMDTGL